MRVVLTNRGWSMMCRGTCENVLSEYVWEEGVNNNGFGSGNVSGQSVQACTTGTHSLSTSSGTSNLPAETLLPIYATTVLLQMYLSLNKKDQWWQPCAHATVAAVSHPETNKSLRNAQPFADTKYGFCVKVVNPDKKSNFSTYVLRDVVREKMNTPDDLRKELIWW